MSNSTVCNITVSIKKTRLTLVKQVDKLSDTLHVCKEKAPVSKQHETYVGLFQQSTEEWVYVCLSSSSKSLVDSYLCVNVMKVLLGVSKRNAPRDVCVFVHARSSVAMSVCMCVSSSLSSRQLLHVYVCI